jgi:hypothetical protein
VTAKWRDFILRTRMIQASYLGLKTDIPEGFHGFSQPLQAGAGTEPYMRTLLFSSTPFLPLGISEVFPNYPNIRRYVGFIIGSTDMIRVSVTGLNPQSPRHLHDNLHHETRKP